MQISGEYIFLGVGLIIAVILFFLLKNRKAKRPYGQTFEHSKTSLLEPLENEDGTPEKLSPRKRAAGVSFLSVWLFFWTFGVYFAVQEWLRLSYGEDGFVFISLWLAAAIPGWFFAAWTLFRLLRGDDIAFDFDSDTD